MKTALRTITIAGLLLLVVAMMFGQTAQMTRLVTIAGDSTVKFTTRGPVDYLPSGVIWLTGADYPVANVGRMIAYVSPDNGATWTRRSVYTYPAVGSASGITGIAAKDANTAVVVTAAGEILRTTDGGVTWATTYSYSPGDGFCDGVKWMAGDTLIAYGDADALGLMVARSFDAGKTWTRVSNTRAVLPGDSLNAPAGVGVYAGYATYGQCMEAYGRTAWLSLYNTANDPPSILKTTDAGATWSWFRITLPGGPATNYRLKSLTFKDENVGFGVDNNNYLTKTTDGGRTWSDTISVEPGVSHNDAKPMTVRAIRGTNTVIAVGYGAIGAKSWISTNNGATWKPIPTATPSTSADLRNLAFGPSTQGIALGVYNIAKITIDNSIPVQTQLYLNDDFSGAAGTALTSAGWTISGTSTVNPLTITAPGLTFTGHPGSAVGASVPMANNGQDVYKTFSPVSSGNVYLSFLLNVSAALTGDYIIAMSPSASQTNYYARLHLKSSGSGYCFGISKSNEVSGGALYSSTVFNLNTTYFVTVKYTFTGTAADSTNDPISVFVLPSGSSLATEPATPEINAYATATKTDAADLASVTLRQGSATSAPTLSIDAVRVGNSWGAATAALQDSVNVTFWANTSTVPDTLKSNSFVQIRGSAPIFGPWSSGSKAILTNVAGDYWKGTYKMKVGDTIQYKFFTNAKSPLPSTANDQGWENNLSDPSTNRILIVGLSDMTIPVQYVNGTPKPQAQFFTPYVNQADSVELYFRINMQGNESFKKATQYMGVKGGFAGTYYDGWGKAVVLTQEANHGNGGSQQYDGTNFWSGYVRVPKSTVASSIEYKFVIMDAPSPTAGVVAWEEGIRPAPDAPGNRVISSNAGTSDTTLYWKWWANAPYAGFTGSDTVIVTFRANLQAAIAQRGFTFSDTLQVRSGYGATAKDVRTKAMTRSGLTGTIFTATDTVIAAVGKALHYQYYLVKSGNDVREVFYDYDWPPTADVSQAERRKITLASKSVTLFDTSSSQTDMRRMPRFRNSTRLSKAVTVTYTLNLRPAYYQVARGDTLFDIQGTNNIVRSSNIKTLGVGINGPAVGSWASWGPAMIAPPDTVHKMYDDGTHGDAVANDTIYTVQYKYTTADVLGQEFKFGIGGSDNEGGKGGFGNNHIENIDDATATFTIASDWGSINPKYYSTWDFTNHKAKTPTAVEDNWSVPMQYDLSQNYPNPFNPSTTIQFTIPTSDIVTLKIFNVLGQEVMTLLNEKMDAGKHIVKFDATRLTSGVYLYQVSAGKFVGTKKMMLLK
jgi:photosystem II stability/assembly factor-like uncharacterized protein